MSGLSDKNKLEVLRLLASGRYGAEPVTEKRDDAQVARVVEHDGTVRVIKSHDTKSRTRRNEMAFAKATQRVVENLSPREAEAFPSITHTVHHRDQVTLTQRFEGLDFTDLTQLFMKDPLGRDRNPLFYLAMYGGALRALRNLHAHGFLHCDVQPQNYCVHVTVGERDGGFEVTPNFHLVRAIDFGCSLLPPRERAAQFEYLPKIADGYVSPQYRAARGPAWQVNEKDPAPFVRLSPASDLWSLGFHIRKVLETMELDPGVEAKFGAQPRRALDYLEKLPRRLGYEDEAAANPTPMVTAEGDLGIDLTLHDRLLGEIDALTYDWCCGPVLVKGPLAPVHAEEKSVVIGSLATPPAALPLRPLIAASMVGIAVVAAAAWQMRPEPAPGVALPQPVVQKVSMPQPVTARPMTLVDCRAPSQELDAVLSRSETPSPELLEKMRAALPACRHLLLNADALGDDARPVLMAAAYFSLHLGLPAEAEMHARHLQHRFDCEWMGHFVMAKLRASERNADATLEALARATECGLRAETLRDERSQFAFLSGQVAFTAIERKLADR